MVNKKLGLGILVIGLVFGMTVVGNLEAQTDNGGEFILTDIPAKYNGKYAILIGGNDSGRMSISSGDGTNEGATKTFPIIDGKVIFPLWVIDVNKGRYFERYSGNDTCFIKIVILQKEDIRSRQLETVNFDRTNKNLFSPITDDRIKFSNGSATGSYKNKSIWVNR
jgi:hypothetical protein